jgi:hypothetical protein
VTLPAALDFRPMRVGNDAGWLLAFHRENPAGAIEERDGVLELSSDDYNAEIQASLPAGLEGGVYRFTIEGLRDDHYEQISQNVPDRYTVVRLHLYWRDTVSGLADYLAGLASLDRLGRLTAESVGGKVAELAIVGVSRRLGSRRYETEIVARERVFERLSRPLCGNGIDVAPIEAALDAVLLPFELATRIYPLTASDTCPALAREDASLRTLKLELGMSGVECLRTLAAKMEERTRRYGRGMLLIRDGVLHIGPRDLPLEEGVKDLSPQTGLVESEALPKLVTDPGFDFCARKTEKPLERHQYKLTLKGRPDLKPGDVVRFSPPPEEVKPKPAGFGATGLVSALRSGPLLPSLGGVEEPSMRLHVNTVEHRLGRTSGFVTTLTGVELADGADDWDCHTKPSRARRKAPAGGTPETQAAQAVLDKSEDIARKRAQTEVGEVRTAVTTAGTEPAQSLVVWRGLVDGDGAGSEAAALDIARPSPAPATRVPYLTPFAFGRCGLVLPRYPGTRVAVSHRGGRTDDPLDVGAFWQAGTAPESQAGDWWLALPAAVPASERERLADDAETPSPYSGSASNDLIDADGNRVIEVGELTVRVGRSALRPAGARPKRADEKNAVTIEHADGDARLVIEPDGTIVIRGAAIRLQATRDIELAAANVRVSVSGTMDVS